LIVIDNLLDVREFLTEVCIEFNHSFFYKFLFDYFLLWLEIISDVEVTRN